MLAERKCSICGVILKDLDDTHSAQPVKEGVCCSKCNVSVVIPNRVKNIRSEYNGGSS